jgi:hypothetical protein
MSLFRETIYTLKWLAIVIASLLFITLFLVNKHYCGAFFLSAKKSQDCHEKHPSFM